MVDWSQCVCAAFDAFLPGFARWCYFVDMWVAEGHTAQWPWLMCVESASPRNVGVDRHRACPHHRDVGPLVHSRCQCWCDPLGNNGSCEVVCVSIAVVGPTLVTPDGRGGVVRMRVRSFDIPWWVCVVAVVGLCDRRFGTPWRHPIDT